MAILRKTALLSTVGIAGLLTACSDSPTVPGPVRGSAIAPPNFALIQQPTNFPTSPNTITVCSANAAATFSVTFDNAIGTIKAPPLVGGPAYTLAVAAGSCETIWEKGAPTDEPDDDVTTATVVQTGQAAEYEFQMVEVGGEIPGNLATNATKTATLKANAFHGATATFTQQLVPETSCTYTIGWYQNKGAVGLPGGAFYNTGLTYLAVLQKDPDGNHYYIVARQYIAAVQNGAAGWGSQNVATTLALAAAYFTDLQTNGISPNSNPTYNGKYKKDTLSAWATVLDEFNRGVRGPGKCTG